MGSDRFCSSRERRSGHHDAAMGSGLGGPGRARRAMTFGDRLFRAGNLRKAQERWEQALDAAPNSAEPRLRLAELALVRGDYREAANRLREAQAADPKWLSKASDIE